MKNTVVFAFALLSLANFALQGQSVETILAGAMNGDSGAQYQIGTLLEEGKVYRQDLAKAAHWYEKAANQGNEKAARRLASLYGKGEGVVKNAKLSAAWNAFADSLEGKLAGGNQFAGNLPPLPAAASKTVVPRKPMAFLSSKTEPPLNIGGAIKFVSVTKDSSRIYAEPSRDSMVIGSAEWMTPFVVIKIQRDGSMPMYKVGTYVSNDEAEVVGWIRKRDLLTSDSALKEQGVYVKAFPVTRFDDKEDKVEGAKCFPEPSSEGTPIGQEFTQFGIYYVFDEFTEVATQKTYYLIGRDPSIFDPRKPGGTIMGWVHDRRMHKWHTREAAEYDKSTLAERKPTVIYETEGDIKKVIMGGLTRGIEPLFRENPDNKEMRHADRRYPIIAKREAAGKEYWNVAFVAGADGIGTRRASVNKFCFLTNRPAVDVLFVIDGTGSMDEFKDPVIAAVRSIQESMIDFWQQHFKAEQAPALRFSVAMYKDYSEADYYRRTPVEERNIGEIAELLNAQSFAGGKSKPAVFHGLSSAVKDASTELDPASLRAVFLIGRMGNLGVSTGGDKNGHTIDSVVRILKSNNMDFHAIHVGTEYIGDPKVPLEIQNALKRFKTETETIKNRLHEGLSGYIALSDPEKVTDHIKEKVTDLLDARFRVFFEPVFLEEENRETLLEPGAIQLMKQNGIDPREFAQKKVLPFFEGWVAPNCLITGKRQMKPVILMERREVENLISVLGRLTTIKAENAGKGWMKGLEEVAGDDIKIGQNDSPADLFRKHLGIKVKSQILHKSFAEISNLPQAEIAEAVKDFQDKLLRLRGVVNEKEITISKNPKTGRPDFQIVGDKKYWFGHRGALHVWLDRDIFIP